MLHRPVRAVWIAVAVPLLFGCGGGGPLSSLKAKDLVGTWDYYEPGSSINGCLVLVQDGTYQVQAIPTLDLLDGKTGTPASAGTWKFNTSFSPPRISLCFKQAGSSGEDFYCHLPLSYQNGKLSILVYEGDPDSSELKVFTLQK